MRLFHVGMTLGVTQGVTQIKTKCYERGDTRGDIFETLTPLFSSGFPTKNIDNYGKKTIKPPLSTTYISHLLAT